MKKKLLKLKSDKEAEDFVATADLTEYNLSGMKRMRFEFAPKDRESVQRHRKWQARIQRRARIAITHMCTYMLLKP
jgi:predicted DNA binding CopG/RHH family protein